MLLLPLTSRWTRLLSGSLTGAKIIIAVLISAPFVSAQAPRPVRMEQGRLLSVAGEGKVSTAPDRAVVRLGAQAQEKEASAAQAKVNEMIEKALAQIKELDIPERSVRTTGLNLHPVYTDGRDNEEPRVAAYRAANVVEVTVDDLELIGKVIDASVEAGVNRLEGVTFELKNDLPQRTEALRLAIKEAETKAKVMAQAVGERLGKVQEVVEGGVSTEPPQPFYEMAQLRVGRGISTPVQPGELVVRASVTLRYRLGGL